MLCTDWLSGPVWPLREVEKVAASSGFAFEFKWQKTLADGLLATQLLVSQSKKHIVAGERKVHLSKV